MPNKTAKHVVTDDEIRQFNSIRAGHTMTQKVFSNTEIKTVLKQLGYGGHDAFLKAMCEGFNPPVVRIERGKYTFNKEPVLKTRLQTVWDTYTKLANPRNYKDSKFKNVCSEEQAIACLKELGYRIWKPETKYIEV